MDWPLGRLSEVGVSSGAFSTCWVVGPSAVFRSPACTSVVGWPLEGCFSCDRVVEDSSADGVLEEACPASEAIVRSSAGFGSSDGPSVGGCSSEGVATAGRSLETSPTGRSFARPSARCRSSDGHPAAGWSLQRLSKTGGILEGTPVDGKLTVIHDGVCGFSERLPKVGDSTGAIGLFAVATRGLLDLRGAMLEGM